MVRAWSMHLFISRLWSCQHLDVNRTSSHCVFKKMRSPSAAMPMMHDNRQKLFMQKHFLALSFNCCNILFCWKQMQSCDEKSWMKHKHCLHHCEAACNLLTITACTGGTVLMTPILFFQFCPFVDVPWSCLLMCAKNRCCSIWADSLLVWLSSWNWLLKHAEWSAVEALERSTLQAWTTGF